ncbi:MAG: hypothetical protein QXJ02_06045 [Candidatus Bathyarchaeia archaeon]
MNSGVAFVKAAEGEYFVAGASRLFESEDSRKTVAVKLAKNVLGIDTDAYNSLSCEDYNGAVFVWLSQGKTTSYVLVEFINQKFHYMGVRSYILHSKYNASFIDPALLPRTNSNIIAIATEVLNNYKELVNASYVDRFVPLLSMVSDPHKSQNITQDDVTLRLTYISEKNSVNMFFVLSFYEIPAVGLSFEISSTGYVTSLRDTISIYKIGKTEISITKEEAIRIALENASQYINALGAQVVKTEATLYMVQGRYGDRYLLYPEWQVQFVFDKHYNHSIFGYAVSLWADTGEITYSMYQGEYGDSPNSALQYLLLIPPIAMGVLCAAIVWTKKKPKKTALNKKPFKTLNCRRF